MLANYFAGVRIVEFDVEPFDPDATPLPCGSARREGDEYVCAQKHCGLRWDTREDRPPCPKED